MAVIDSGIDAEHPGFNGQVKHQIWFRGGTPLVEDDHGTHVAGTIHYMSPMLNCTIIECLVPKGHFYTATETHP